MLVCTIDRTHIAGHHLSISVFSLQVYNTSHALLRLVWSQARKADVVEVLGHLLEEAGMQEVLALPKARMPVVKFLEPHTGVKVDITVNNLLALVNTKLLADYG